MTATTEAPTTVRAHRWELSGLGRAPFRYVGMYESLFKMPDGSVKAGGSFGSYELTGEVSGTARVKAHDEYQGEKQTLITNPRWKD